MIQTGVVEKVVAGGSGLIRSAAGVVLVPQALPGETIEYGVPAGRSRGVLRGRLCRVLEPNPGRREPACPWYARCGGCDLMQADQALQARIKRDIFLDAMTRQGGAALAPWRGLLAGLELFQGPEWEYRARFRFHRGAHGRPALKARQTNQTVELPDCPVAHPRIRAWLARGEALPDSPGPAAAGHRQRRPAAAETPGEDDDTASGGFRVFASPEGLFLEGQERQISIRGQAFRFGPEAFFQSNPAMLERLLDWLLPRIAAWVAGLDSQDRDSLVLADLYGGMGTFSRYLPAVGQLWMVEENPQACASARLALAGRPGTRVHCGSVDSWLHQAKRLDLVIVDPPRGGLSPSLVAHLGRIRPRRLVYVSCDPVTLARDAGILAQAGMALAGGALFDFYPQTWHLESVLEFVPAAHAAGAPDRT